MIFNLDLVAPPISSALRGAAPVLDVSSPLMNSQTVPDMDAGIVDIFGVLCTHMAQSIQVTLFLPQSPLSVSIQVLRFQQRFLTGGNPITQSKRRQFCHGILAPATHFLPSSHGATARRSNTHMAPYARPSIAVKKVTNGSIARAAPRTGKLQFAWRALVKAVL